MKTRRTVTIDWGPERASGFGREWVIVGIDVIRATTTICTAVAGNRRCLVAESLEHALRLATAEDDPLLAGEVAGVQLPGLELQNSPAVLAARTDVHRPLILVSSTGTRLLHNAAQAVDRVYAASMRNVSAQVDHLADCDGPVAVIGAGTRGTFREEDQAGCAAVAAGLLARGWQADAATRHLVARWRDAPVSAWASGASAAYLRSSGQERDLEFVTTHLDDIPAVFEMKGEEIFLIPVP